jgi:uncharacterized protein (UPF0276 family)
MHGVRLSTIGGRTPVPIPACAGIGLRAPHYAEVLDSRPRLGWVEVHSENFFAAGGRVRWVLEQIRRDYPVSLHGVGLALGSTDPLDRRHLRKLVELVARVEPALVSEHLSWGAVGGRHHNDLLPLPYTEEALRHMVRRVSAVQEALGRELLIENVSSYLCFQTSVIPEWEFLAELVQRTGCRLLLDVNNVYVSASNHGFSADTYLRGVPPKAVAELHLAGFSARQADGRRILIDTHDAPVAEAVWSLYARALAYFGPRPTLIEWDSKLPSLSRLLAEAARAQAILESTRVRAA